LAISLVDSWCSFGESFRRTGALSDKLAQWRPFPQLLEDARLVEGVEGVQAAGVQDMSSRNSSSGEKKTTLLINVYWAGKSAAITHSPKT